MVTTRDRRSDCDAKCRVDHNLKVEKFYVETYGWKNMETEITRKLKYTNVIFRQENGRDFHKLWNKRDILFQLGYKYIVYWYHIGTNINMWYILVKMKIVSNKKKTLSCFDNQWFFMTMYIHVPNLQFIFCSMFKTLQLFINWYYNKYYLFSYY